MFQAGFMLLSQQNQTKVGKLKLNFIIDTKKNFVFPFCDQTKTRKLKIGLLAEFDLEI